MTISPAPAEPRSPEPRSLVELLRSRSAERPTAEIFTFLRDGEADEVRLTYAELDAGARAVAAALQEAGAAGERALLLYPPGLEYVTAFFGCLYAGTVAVPVYPPRTGGRGGAAGAARLAAILASAEARFALAPRALLAAAAGALPEAGLRRLASDEIPADAAAGWRDPGAGAGTLAFLQYTSGSTAEPKGVMLSHGNLLHNLELIRRGFGVGPADRAVIWLPPYHDMGLIGGLLEPVYADFPVVLFSP
ncbi:MAG TPA: AMP-binding protein, partial [Thermoanaerobaculia bacterium]|nr:AMP-binding protein [Thermoanaerobaculia bacterium]